MTGEELAPVMHEAYLECARRVGWPIRPEIDVPFEHMSENAKELDRAIGAAVLAALARERGEAIDTAGEMLGKLLDENTALRERGDRLKEAILWALGRRDEFPPRQPGQGAYWWRRELGKRADLDATR